MIGIWVALMSLVDATEIGKNWEKYRCQPTVIPFASFYGHNTTENFNYCLKGMVDSEAGGLLAPVFQIISVSLGVLSTLMSAANSMRLQFATFMGGVNTIFQNFADRIKQLMMQMKISAARIRLLMGRLYGTFFALIYTATSGMMALSNFSRTPLYFFLDLLFCFDPDTIVKIKDKGEIKVKDVRIGDVFELTGSKVTSTLSFESDGQPMVDIHGVIVSTNHYLQYNGTYLKAGDHPHAKPLPDWSGGIERPLICFNTSDHIIPIGDLRFLDYDETEEGDQESMNWLNHVLNGKPKKEIKRPFNCTTAFHPDTVLQRADHGEIKASEVSLGDTLSTGRVIGKIKKEVFEVCYLPTGECVTPGLGIWDPSQSQWIRAGDFYPIEKLKEPIIFSNFIVRKTASIETAKGTVYRDYLEVHSQDSEQFYANAIAQMLPSH